MEVAATTKPARNASIDLVRLPAALAVVMNHTSLFLDGDSAFGYFFTEYLPRFTLPFFLGVSGYYFIGALLAGRRPLGKSLTSVVRSYALWSLLYYLASFVVNVLMGGEPLGQFLAERVVYFFTRGSYFHLWYFPALIYSMLLVSAVHRLFGRRGLTWLTWVSLLLVTVGALGSSYMTLGLRIPVLNRFFLWPGFETFRGIFLMGVPYFLLGYVLRVWNERQAPGNALLHGLFAAMAVLYLGEIALLVHLRWVERPQVMFSTYWLTLVLIAILLRHPLPRFGRLAQWCNLQSGFVYYVHGLVMMGALKAADLLGGSLAGVRFTLLVMGLSLLLGQVCLWWRNPFTALLLGKGGVLRAAKE